MLLSTGLIVDISFGIFPLGKKYWLVSDSFCQLFGPPRRSCFVCFLGFGDKSIQWRLYSLYKKVIVVINVVTLRFSRPVSFLKVGIEGIVISLVIVVCFYFNRIFMVDIAKSCHIKHSWSLEPNGGTWIRLVMLLGSCVFIKSRTEDYWPGWWRVGSSTHWIRKESCITSRNLVDSDVELLEQWESTQFMSGKLKSPISSSWVWLYCWEILWNISNSLELSDSADAGDL